MSSRYASSESDYSESRPDKPLVVKFNYEGVSRKVTFNSSRACTYDLLKRKVEQCFPLSMTSYAITYTDDDGETTEITTEGDLTEAIRYFHPGGDDPPLSSAASILSGRSFGRSKITLRVKISVDYDGPSLSDTSSLASMDEYKQRNGSASSFSFSSPSVVSGRGEVDDDSVTVSSKDMGTRYDYHREGKRGTKTIAPGPSREPLIRPSPPSRSSSLNDWDTETVSSIPQSSNARSLGVRSLPSIEDNGEDIPANTAEGSSAVFERLKMQEGQRAAVNHGASPLQSEWLRDQNERTIKLMLGDLPAPSESDQTSLNIIEDSDSAMSGALALQKDPRGKFYYAYTSGSSSVPASAESGDDASSILYDADGSLVDSVDLLERDRRPTSMEISWIESQVITTKSEPTRPSSSNPHPPNHRSHSEPLLSPDPSIDPDLLPFLGDPPPPPHTTDCSKCGILLTTFRYVCATCGEKEPLSSDSERSVDGKGKAKDISETLSSPPRPIHSYPPVPLMYGAPSPSASSLTVVSDTENPFNDPHCMKFGRKPLPAIPSPVSPLSSPSSSTINGPKSNGSVSEGYELCANCFHLYGLDHVLDSTDQSVSSPGNDSPMDTTRRTPSERRRTASKKGQLRHAFHEKLWGLRGWTDVEQDDHQSCKCSTCEKVIVEKRYKCMSCKLILCITCYSLVHEIDPSHVFKVVPDKPMRSRSEPVLEHIPLMPDDTGEISMMHRGVKCFHCLQDIIGARYHCAVCESVDICSNCESAGLPGNLDSSDDGHNSSHIMIKIPYPLPSDELQSASRRAKQLWGKDGANLGEPSHRSRRTSLHSAYAHTVIGSALTLDTVTSNGSFNAHGHRCGHCNHLIVGVRYQCGGCPSKPNPYNLCSACEASSFAIHDPMHIFFKLNRPVDVPLESDAPFLPILYRTPAGPPGGVYNRDYPAEYLQHLQHPAALCDLCMQRITGIWFRCVYCAKDLCDRCEEVDTHNDTHFFMVLKSIVDMQVFKRFAQLNNPESPPVVNYPVYHHHS